MGLSWTAGALTKASVNARTPAALLILTVAVFFAVFALVVVFGLVDVFLVAGLVADAFLLVAVFCQCVSDKAFQRITTLLTLAEGVLLVLLVDVLVVTFLSTLGLVADDVLDAASFLASFTGPEGPFGRSNSPAFSPLLSACAMCLSNAVSVVLPRSLLALTYFLIA